MYGACAADAGGYSGGDAGGGGGGDGVYKFIFNSQPNKAKSYFTGSNLSNDLKLYQVHLELISH